MRINNSVIPLDSHQLASTLNRPETAPLGVGNHYHSHDWTINQLIDLMQYPLNTLELHPITQTSTKNNRETLYKQGANHQLHCNHMRC